MLRCAGPGRLPITWRADLLAGKLLLPGVSCTGYFAANCSYRAGCACVTLASIARPSGNAQCFETCRPWQELRLAGDDACAGRPAGRLPLWAAQRRSTSTHRVNLAYFLAIPQEGMAASGRSRVLELPKLATHCRPSEAILNGRSGAGGSNNRILVSRGCVKTRAYRGASKNRPRRIAQVAFFEASQGVDDPQEGHGKTFSHSLS